MASNEIVDLFFGLLMQILEFVHGGKFGDIETIGQHTIGLALQEMLALVCRNVGDRGEHVTGVCSCALDAVSVVDTTLSSFSINIKIL